MISDRQIAAALESHRVSVGAASVSVSRSVYSPSFEWFSATFMDADHACATEKGETLAEAIDKAKLGLRLKRDENARRAGVALAYSSDWEASAWPTK